MHRSGEEREEKKGGGGKGTKSAFSPLSLSLSLSLSPSLPLLSFPAKVNIMNFCPLRAMKKKAARREKEEEGRTKKTFCGFLLVFLCAFGKTPCACALHIHTELFAENS